MNTITYVCFYDLKWNLYISTFELQPPPPGRPPGAQRSPAAGAAGEFVVHPLEALHPVVRQMAEEAVMYIGNQPVAQGRRETHCCCAWGGGEHKWGEGWGKGRGLRGLGGGSHPPPIYVRLGPSNLASFYTVGGPPTRVGGSCRTPVRVFKRCLHRSLGKRGMGVSGTTLQPRSPV